MKIVAFDLDGTVADTIPMCIKVFCESGVRINNRLLCGIATYEDFVALLTDTEIYVDGIATSRFNEIANPPAMLGRIG